MIAFRFRGPLVLVLLVPLLAGCQPTGGHVAAVATGHFTARHEFPVVLVAWCGDAPPRQIDLLGDSGRRHLVATREFEGSELEIDLAAPGEDWEILDGNGDPVYRLVPESSEEEFLLGVGSEAAAAGERTEHDIGALVFTPGALDEEEGAYTRPPDSSEARYTPPEEFPPAC